MPKPRHGIYLEKDFRNILFSKAYENAGGSLGAMARELGYQGAGRNGVVRNMWLGTITVSAPKIERLAKLARIPLSKILSHEVTKEQNLVIRDWVEGFSQYKNSSGERQKKSGC